MASCEGISRWKGNKMRSVCLALVCVLLVVSGCRMGVEGQKGPPQWVDEPESIAPPGMFISSVGVAEPPGDKETLLERAEHAARAELGKASANYAQAIMAEFLSMPENGIAPASSGSRNFIATVGTGTSNAILRQSFRHDTWYDPRTGGVCVLYRVPVSVVNDRLLEAFNTALIQTHLFPDESAAKARTYLEHLLNDRLRALTAGTVGQEPPAPEVEGEPVAPEAPPEGFPPQWLAVGEHEQYPITRFMSAIGVGESEEAARANSSAELASEVLGRMMARRTIALALGPQSPLAKNLRVLPPEALRFDEGDLVGYKCVETWYDPLTNLSYALGVLDRETAANAWKARLADGISTAQQLLESGRSNHKADNYSPALSDYLTSLQKLQQGLRWQLAAMVVAPEGADQTAQADPEGLLPKAQEGLKLLLSDLSLRKVSGDNQWTPGGVGLAEALIVQLVAGDARTPVEGLPLQFAFQTGKGKLSQSVRTGPDGRAGCKVNRVEPLRGIAGEIECRLDLEQVAGGADLGGLQGPGVQFNFATRSKRNSRIALYLDETDLSGQRVRTQAIEQTLTEAIGKAGFKLVDPERVRLSAERAGITGESSEQELTRALAGLAQGTDEDGFVLVVAARATPVLIDTAETTQGTLYYVYTTVRTRVIDPALPSGQTILELEEVGKDAFLDDLSEALRRSKAKASELAGRKLIDALNKRFGEK